MDRSQGSLGPSVMPVKEVKAGLTVSQCYELQLYFNSRQSSVQGRGEIQGVNVSDSTNCAPAPCTKWE